MYRFYETIPGMLAWGTITLLFSFSWIFPEAMAIFIILFDIYWLLKTIFLSTHLRASFSLMRKNLKIDWLGKLQTMTNDDDYDAMPRTMTNGNDDDTTLNGHSHSHAHRRGNWQDIYHLIILPMYNEPYEVIRESMQSLANAAYPKEKFIVVLGVEKEGYKNL